LTLPSEPPDEGEVPGILPQDERTSTPEEGLTEEGVTEHASKYSAFRNGVLHEAELINQRLNWNLSIQGFLFAAYTFTLQKASEVKAGLLEHLSREALSNVEDIRYLIDHAPGLRELWWAMVFLAVIGWLVSLLVYVSVLAARLAQEEFQARWLDKHEEYGTDHSSKRNDSYRHTHGPHYPGILAAGLRDIFKLGLTASLGLPLAFVLV
jgi:hypothetical protein